MKRILNTLMTIMLLPIGESALAQGENVEMADGMRADGKIYVVVAIVLVILIGLIVYLFAMDRKVSKLENELNQHRKQK